MKKDILAGIVVGVVLQALLVKLLNTNINDFPQVNSWYSGFPSLFEYKICSYDTCNKKYSKLTSLS